MMLLVKLIDGKCLVEGLWRILLDEIAKWKATEISILCFYSNQSVVEDDNNKDEESEVDDASTLRSSKWFYKY